MTKFFSLIFLLCSLSVSHAKDPSFQLPVDCKQAIVGVAATWDSSHVTLSIYEKKKGVWTKQGESWPGRLGRNGLARGLGMHPHFSAPQAKKEGDKRAPAGVFAIGGAYGYAAEIKKHRSLPYRQITTRDLWVEDVTSKFYNRHLVLNHEPTTKWEKKAQMRQNDHAHSLKLYIGHNTATAKQPAKPGLGSSIFFHIWRGGGSKPTAGCTTMHETKLKQLIAAITPKKNPVYILLPKAEYQKYRSLWKLP